MPRNIQQVWNINRHNNDVVVEKDELFALIKRCKEDESSQKPFLRFVQGAPYPMCFLANDRQLHDIVKCCTNQKKFAILGLDTTYNCGEFWLTTTAYKQLQLRTRRGGNPPVLNGPALLHKTKDEATFRYMSSCMTRLCPDIQNVRAVGTDRDRALFNGFLQQFPRAIHVLCKKHMEDDIQRKLTHLGITGNYKIDFIKDIFGSAAEHQSGMVDCTDASEFRQKLAEFKDTWESRERLARDSNSCSFFSWFEKYQAKDIEEKMLLNIRRNAGLGDEFFLNNDVESSHHALKHSCHHKLSDWPTFVKKLRELVDRQQRDVERSLVNTGPYKLAPHYNNLEVSVDRWFSDMSEEQRVRYIQRFLRRPLITSPRSTPPAQKSVKMPMAQDIQQKHSSEKDSTRDLPKFEDTGLPPLTYARSWRNAQKILNTPNGIVDDPGNSSGKMVISLTTSQPHLVKTPGTGKFVCGCQGYRERNLCAHAISTAAYTCQIWELLSNFHKSARSSDLMECSSQGAPKQIGKKPGHRERKRKRTCSPRKTESMTSRQPSANIPRAAKKSRPENPSQSREDRLTYKLKWLKGTRVKKCYGCGGSIRDPPHVPPPPNDMVFTCNEYRLYPTTEGTLRFSMKKEATHYHLSIACIQQKKQELQSSRC